MNIILQALNWLWDLKALTGIRTKVARAVIIGLPIYAALATSAGIGDRLPDLDPKVLAAILAWLGSKIPGFAKAHQP